ncbi:MAG: 30S ribosomal protein S6 [Wolbachia sp.]|nr:30S ribosomal protein S6 [Wolbachia sp.]MDD9336382.1 30S ribosomal protein S6 [Wolbachia sp.]
MNLYEFAFIAQQGLLQQEVEGMVQELAVLLKNIKAEVIFQEVKSFIEKVNDKLTKQELETYSKKTQEELVVYSNILEKVIKSLWAELEEDFSNLKEVKLKIDKELRDALKKIGMTQELIKLPKINERSTRSAFIHNTVNALKGIVLEHVEKGLQGILKDFGIDNTAQSSKTLSKLLRNIEASGLIKYEHWGLLDFAYPINKMKSGHYCILCVSSTPSIMDEFVRKVKLNENVVRYLSIQVDKFFEGKSYMMNKQNEEQGV